MNDFWDRKRSKPQRFTKLVSRFSYRTRVGVDSEFILSKRRLSLTRPRANGKAEMREGQRATTGSSSITHLLLRLALCAWLCGLCSWHLALGSLRLACYSPPHASRNLSHEEPR